MKKLKKKFKRSYITTLREIRETKNMFRTFINKDEKNYHHAKAQAKDVVKFTFLSVLFIIPGSVVIITVIQLIAKKFNSSIFPSKQQFKK